MFDFLLARRKASDCEKLIRRLQCRLELLKNKRNSIVSWLRGAIAQLLQDGHKQTAFDRVEQIFKDESIVAVYKLLDIYCEFIVFDLPDICKHRDCPNYVNEAASTLIFASARLGDLPELRAIQKFFGELYGQRFNLVALELLPGNLVNPQVKVLLSITSVPDYVKYKLLDEIARSCPKPEAHLEQVNSCTSLDQDWDAPRAGSDASISPLSLPWYVDKKDEWGTGNYAHLESPHESRLPASLATESSSDSSYRLPKEIIFLDEVEEFKSTMGTDGNGQDQRLFLFKTPVSCQNCRCLTNGEAIILNREVKWALVLHKPSREFRIGVIMPNEAKNEVGKPDGFVNAPNLRAMPMPVERSSDCRVDHMVRSNTFPFHQASHVHPKLPDYDELAAKFMALKKANLECKSDQFTLAA